MRSLHLCGMLVLSVGLAVATSAAAEAPPLEVPGEFRIPAPAGCHSWTVLGTLFTSVPVGASPGSDEVAFLGVRRDPAGGNDAARAEFIRRGRAVAAEGFRSGGDVKDDCPPLDGGPIPDRVSFTVSGTGKSGQPCVVRVATFFGKQADYRLIAMAKTERRAAEMAKAMDGLVELGPAPVGTLVVPGWFQVPAPDGFVWRLHESRDVLGIPVRVYRAKPVNGHGEDDEVVLVARRPAPRTEADRAGLAKDLYEGAMGVLKKLHCTDLHGEPPAADPVDPERRPYRVSGRTPEGKTLIVHGAARVVRKGYYAFSVIANSEERAAQLEAAVVPRLTELEGEFVDGAKRVAATTRPRRGGEKAWGVVGVTTELVGGTGGGAFAIVEGDGPVVGFRYEFGSWDGKPVMRRLEPVYAAGKNVPVGKKKEVMGRAGYVVGGLIVDGDKNVNAVKVMFVRREDGKAGDGYTTEWIGTPRAGNEKKQLAGNGEKVIGVYGRAGMNLDAVGLVVKGEAAQKQ